MVEKYVRLRRNFDPSGVSVETTLAKRGDGCSTGISKKCSSIDLGHQFFQVLANAFQPKMSERDGRSVSVEVDLGFLGRDEVRGIGFRG